MIDAAYKNLELAAEAFKKAITEFEQVYNPSTVGVDEWIESIDDTMFEIKEDISSNQEE